MKKLPLCKLHPNASLHPCCRQRLRQIIFPSAGWVAADQELDGRMRRELGIPEREQPEVVVLKKPWENQEVDEEEEEGRNIIIQMLKSVLDRSGRLVSEQGC